MKARARRIGPLPNEYRKWLTAKAHVRDALKDSNETRQLYYIGPRVVWGD